MWGCLILPLDLATDDLANLVRWLGIPDGSLWVRFKTVEPIRKPLGNVRFEWEHLNGATTVWLLDLSPLKGWEGFNAVVLGTVGRDRPDQHAEPYWFISMGSFGDVNVRLWCARVWETGSPLQAEAAWTDAWGHHYYIRSSATTLKAKELARAGAGLTLLRGLRLALRGRRRLEDSPSSPARLLAEQARELLAIGEVRSVREAASRLGMVNYDELDDDPFREQRAEATAERRLSRYLQTFPAAE